MKLFKDEKGFGNIIYGVVGLVIFLILVSSVALPTVYGANTTTPCNSLTGSRYIGPLNTTCPWAPADIAMWGIVPIVIIASLIMFVVGKK